VSVELVDKQAVPSLKTNIHFLETIHKEVRADWLNQVVHKQR